jgi:assimilatory nitrate reductase catalytic subunit
MNGPAVVEKLRNLVRQWDGKLTRELLLEPGGFGLGQLPAKQKPDRTTTMVCGFCSTGCGLNIHLKSGVAVGLTPSPEYPVNLGMACPKGWESLAVLNAPDRAVVPLLRDANGEQKVVDWDTALRTFAERFKAIQARYGAESVAFLGTGQIVTEELALLGSLAKFGMGIIHGDGNTRQCMATAVTAYKQSFGFDAPPYTYADLEESDVLIFVGSNPCIAHPILWERVLRNPHKPKIIVIDPRKTETALAATQHVALRPKSDLVLFYGLARILIERLWIDRKFIDAHTDDFDAFSEFLKPFTVDVVAQQTGLDPESIENLARTIRDGKRVSFWWTMGVNQSHEGTRTAQSLINLALMTGNIGRVGTGANSITGQCNAMGSRLFSNTTNLLGGRDFTNSKHREEVASILNINPIRIPGANSWSYHEIIQGIHDGKIKGLWIIATNSAHSWINQSSFAEARKKLEFLVVQDMYHSTETAQMADLLLPAAGWGEKEGTFINSERRIGVIKKVAKAPGQALADFHIFKLIAQYWGCADLFKDWETPEAVFSILKKLSRDRPCDITGIDGYRMLDEGGGIQWPYPDAARRPGVPPGRHRRLFEDGVFFHLNGRAKFMFESPKPSPEQTDREYPFLLLTGRGTASQWHTQTRTEKSAVLRKLYPSKVYVEINPDDAAELRIEPGAWVTVSSRRGSLRAQAVLTHQLQRSQLFIPMHYAVTNQLTAPIFDPYSKQPSYKACAVRLESQGD